MADPHAEDEAPAGKQIEGSGLFGHQDGVALGQDKDGRAQAQARDAMDKRGKSDQRLDDIRPGDVRRGHYHQVVGPHRVVTERLGRRSGFGHCSA